MQVKLKNKSFIFRPQYNICVLGEWNYYSNGSLGTNNNMSQMMTTQTISDSVGYHQQRTHGPRQLLRQLPVPSDPLKHSPGDIFPRYV